MTLPSHHHQLEVNLEGLGVTLEDIATLQRIMESNAKAGSIAQPLVPANINLETTASEAKAREATTQQLRNNSRVDPAMEIVGDAQR